MAPELFLAVTLIGAWFTFNAYLPQRAFGAMVVPSFFAGWLTSELVGHHFAWQLLATVGFVAAGALERWPGWLGLAITLASWAGLYGLAVRAERASDSVEAALRDDLGEGYRDAIDPALATRIEQPLHPGRRLVPFLLFDPEVRRIGALPYAPEHGARGELDVYVPRSGASRAPVLFQIHGGGWIIGDKRQQGLPLMLQAARAGWVCVAANYRLSPKATFPDHLIDVKRALAWIRQHIAEYGGDPNLVCVTGGSAGGHLSSMLALSANDPEYQPGFEDVDTSVAACVPFYGVYDWTNSTQRQKHGGMESVVERMILKTPLATHRKEWEKSSPLFRVHPGAPPFFVIHGSHDSLASVEEGRLFAERLREVSQAPVCYAEIPGAQHAFEIFHSKRTTHVVRAVERFLGWVVTRERSHRAA
ncbi:MAG: alpha/beta hydrolase [Deltaproteobacteria bacterium]|nr:alpha/beta hydrolase [Deltaproteobacteria bacterium]